MFNIEGGEVESRLILEQSANVMVNKLNKDGFRLRSI